MASHTKDHDDDRSTNFESIIETKLPTSSPSNRVDTPVSCSGSTISSCSSTPSNCQDIGTHLEESQVTTTTSKTSESMVSIDSFKSSHNICTQDKNSSLDSKQPIQEVYASNSLTKAQENSDDDYQSADEGNEDYSGDNESDDFIPTSDLLTGEERTENSEEISELEDEYKEEFDDSGDADQSEEDSQQPAVEETVEDPLEIRRRLEESLTQEEKLERKSKSQSLKDDGNVLFRNEQYEEAITSYSEALEICPLDFQKERSIMFANRAACKMKQEEYEQAIKDSSSALELHPHYLKAMLRRAELYEKIDKLDEALKDYQKAVELDPSQHAARAACIKLAEQIKDRNEKMKEEMIGKLKDLGNMVLRPFGLSVNNFNLQQDPNTGSYSVQFNQNAPGNGK